MGEVEAGGSLPPKQSVSGMDGSDSEGHSNRSLKSALGGKGSLRSIGSTRSVRIARMEAEEREAAKVEEDRETAIPLSAGYSPRVGNTTMITGIPVSKAFLSGPGIDPDLFPRAVEDAKEHLWVAARRWALKHTGVSLSLTSEDDAALRLSAVATAPWLQPSRSFVEEANLLGANPLHPIPARSPTAVLGGLIGPCVYTPLHAAPHAALLHGDGLQGLMAAHPAVILRVTRLCMTAVYTLHALYAVGSEFFFRGAPGSGLAVAATLCVLDFVMLRLVCQKLVNRSPLWFCLLSFASRAILSNFVSLPWLVGAGLEPRQ